MTAPAPANVTEFLNAAAKAARESGCFASVGIGPGYVHCVDRVQEDAAFRIASEEGKLWLCWVSPNRYLSQSIEAEVRWTGDDIDELVDEEVADQGWGGAKVGRFQHFRSEEKLFTFRSELPMSPGEVDGTRAADALKLLLAYQAAFRNLGDMKADDED